MNKAIRIIIPLVLILAIVICTGWYLFIYDRAFTRDILLYTARQLEENGKHNASTWFYNSAYKQAGNSESVAIELANQYKAIGNYTKAEYTLSKAIADGGGVDLYIALCKTFVEQDKLLDAVNMLNNVTNKDIKAQLDSLRPAAPTCTPNPSTSGAFYTQYITVTISADKGTLYVSSNGEFPSINKDEYKEGITLKDGENIIYAIAVAENGLVSPTAIFGFTVGGVIKEMDFADTSVEAAIREKLDVTADKVLFTNDLWTITDFTLPAEAENLSDLKHLAFVEKLTISNTVSGQLSNLAGLANIKELSITDMTVNADEIAFIGRLPNLQKLTLNNCSLSTISGLEFAKNLTYLDLGNNAIRDIAPLSKLVNLQTLTMKQNALNDLSALSTLNALTVLDVSFNNLTTISPIATITGLKSLDVSNNSLEEIANVQQLTNLEYLSIACNSISDVDPIAACVKLTKLDVSTNDISDISELSVLDKLETFNFSYNSVTKIPEWDADCALVNIDGSYNKIKTLEPLGGLKKLNNIYMDYNKDISSVKALANCPMLIQVNVYGTKVTQVGVLTTQSIVVNYDPTK